MSGTKKTNDYPPYMYDDGDRGGFLVINPLNKVKKRFGPDQEQQARAAAVLLKEYVETERQQRLLDAGKPLIRGLVEKYISDRLPFEPLSPSTRESKTFKLNRISRELGDRVVVRTDRLFIENWIAAFCPRPDTFNDWRDVFIDLWTYACAQKWCDLNEAAFVLYRSTSLKIEANHKDRLQLDLEGFKAIHRYAPPYLQLAMELSLITLQGRSELCNLQYGDVHDGFIFVIRDKSSADSDMAFIKIAVTPDLEELVGRSRLLDGGVVSPYVVHRKPFKDRREWIEGKPHWTYINPGYLSKAFQTARDSCGHFDELDSHVRPSLHEIRGLGGRLYEAAGMSADDIRALMTHADRKTTEIYLEKGPGALTDADFRPVKAPMRIGEVLRINQHSLNAR